MVSAIIIYSMYSATHFGDSNNFIANRVSGQGVTIMRLSLLLNIIFIRTVDSCVDLLFVPWVRFFSMSKVVGGIKSISLDLSSKSHPSFFLRASSLACLCCSAFFSLLAVLFASRWLFLALYTAFRAPFSTVTCFPSASTTAIQGGFILAFILCITQKVETTFRKPCVDKHCCTRGLHVLASTSYGDMPVRSDNSFLNGIKSPLSAT
mmetsp:Transcript_18373/g.26751  ORF Transcript_18373/g.26751 Transcript_18373/m.26751 type:complete len:207 (+) Transcript_18373:7654-8274(+)